MGKITDSLLSGTRGRTGRIVVSNIEGHEISRMRPRKSNRISTPKQQVIKNRFNFAVQFIQGYKTLAKTYYGKRSGLKSPYNQAMSNLLQAISCDMDTLTFSIQYNNIQFTKGNLLEPQPLNVTADDPLSATITWTNNAIELADQNDVLIIMYAEDDSTKAQSTVVQTAVKRSEETYTLQFLPKYQGTDVHVWMSFLSVIKQDAAPSIYLGQVTVL
ncbi:Uncharacterised protein [Algoriella xinjiangensis]|uniref:DUF6266 family protein n=1 Tax=Algoriella xinjiangensis TaxID=684065 RepID=UPI000F63228A|nr:DUF6266 family protein [Algoriella xinjiangensis]VDH17452.1 Uncharacterised protein [Algoriella xinjiangensis]